MTQVRGQTLEQLLRHSVDLSDERQLFSVLHIFIKVCEAMAFAHSRGVVHCDLKPPNVMVGEHGEVYVMDWGIARLKASARPSGADRREDRVELGRDVRHLDEGKLFGSLAYMPPEQARGLSDAVDERSDVFALGGILYRILVGHAPWYGHSEEEVVELIKSGRFVPPQKAVGPERPLPPQLCAVACRAMSADPADRYQSVDALRNDVELYLSGSGRTPMHAFAAGTLIVREGDAGRSAFVIEKGRCRAFKTTADGKRESLREMGAGEIFGEMALLTEGPRTASVEAVDAVTVRELTADALTAEMGQTFFVGRLLKVLAERFHDADARASALARERDHARVREVALTHLVFGQRDGDCACARWQALRDELGFRFGLGESEALALVGQIPGVSVDAKRDEVVCSATPAPPLAIDELG
jgi:serine/threonine-protein kinase